jgi:hypothetical protein
MASRDYEEFIATLNDHGVRYLLIDGLRKICLPAGTPGKHSTSQ